jgi:endo-1,3(4)-beta-glucanase
VKGESADGKVQALAKFASLILAVQELLGDQGLAQAGLNQLKVAFSRFSQNAQKYPLVYESKFSPVVCREGHECRS